MKKLLRRIKQRLCRHNWQPTDTEGWTMECPKCGAYFSHWEELGRTMRRWMLGEDQK